jgi:hypothetical protein
VYHTFAHLGGLDAPSRALVLLSPHVLQAHLERYAEVAAIYRTGAHCEFTDQLIDLAAKGGGPVAALGKGSTAT